MKKILFFSLFVILLTALQASAQTDDLAGTWVGFDGSDIIFFEFSPDGSEMAIFLSEGEDNEFYNGSWAADGETIFWTQFESEDTNEFPYYFEDEKLYVDWGSSEYTLTRFGDSIYSGFLDESPFIGEDRIYWTSQNDDGTMCFDWYTGDEETVEIPDNVFGNPIIEIGAGAFKGYEGLKHVIIPGGVTYIGGRAFADCEELESIQLPDTLEGLDWKVFENCRSLKEIIIPEGVTYLYADTFLGCDSLTSVVLPESLEDIDATGAFDVNTQDARIFTVKQDSFAEQYCRDKGLNYTALDEENWNLVYGDASETD